MTEHKLGKTNQNKTEPLMYTKKTQKFLQTFLLIHMRILQKF